jgi:hypothetical protein
MGVVYTVSCPLSSPFGNIYLFCLPLDNTPKTGYTAPMNLLTQDIIAFENGELTDEETIALFQALCDTGVIYELQGSYQRVAQQLIAEGLISL